MNGNELLAVGELLEVGLDLLVRELLLAVVVFAHHERVDETLGIGALILRNLLAATQSAE